MVWEVVESEINPGDWFVRDWEHQSGHINWPAPMEDFVSEGTAIMMCEVLNARDYPDVAP